jgi:hypothetical protein
VVACIFKLEKGAIPWNSESNSDYSPGRLIDDAAHLSQSQVTAAAAALQIASLQFAVKSKYFGQPQSRYELAFSKTCQD